MAFKAPRPPSVVEQAAGAQRLVTRLEMLPEAIERHSRATALICVATPAEVSDLKEQLRHGSQPTTPVSLGQRPIDIVLGVDFGTSSVKIAARLPYEPGSPIVAIPVPSFARAEDHPYLWASRLWLGPDGSFSLHPAPRAAVFCAIKAGLMTPPQPGTCTATTLANAAAPEELATAFLALQVQHARGWLASERAALMQRGHLKWSYNFGFPAASLNNAVLSEKYQRCVAAALSLAASAADVTLTTTRAALTGVGSNPTGQLEAMQASLIPEIAAAVSGFANSTMLDDGLYALVDVGGGTVDCCTFNLFKSRDGESKCPIFAADVSMLGVEPWKACSTDRKLANYFRWDLDRRQRGVIWQTKKRRDPNSERWSSALPVFLIGGGVKSAVHAASAHSLDPWLRKFNSAGGGIRLMRLPAAAGLDHELCPATMVDRLAVAIGLSMSVQDIPEIKLPNVIDDIATEQIRPNDDRFVGKEQM